jgi:hypothetical protein
MSDSEHLRTFPVLNRALRDYYRCPDAFLNFGLTGELSEDSGFFRFGADATCYGRSCSGSRQLHPDLLLGNILGCAEVRDGAVNLPFDPTEVIENFRNERYMGAAGSLFQLFRRLYYRARPFMSSSVTQKVQRFHARNWHEISFPKWLVDTTVENLCERSIFYALQANDGVPIPFVWFWPEGARACVRP